MTIEYTGRHTEVTPQIRTLAERKLRKLSRFLRITKVHVILTADKHRQIAEVSVRSPHLDLAATEETTDFATSLSTVIDKLARQAERRTGRVRERKRVAGAPADGAAGAPSPGESGPRVVRSRRFVTRPMTLDEAVVKVGSSPEGCLVFRDAATRRLSVLYRRQDGDLGLIEPEA